ncbi:hypothetical protein L083_3670 [Actinoplanes sp. N902-109]|nr:hypothetical protein L083_3670 [Actinoplanes sp. N902-109]
MLVRKRSLITVRERIAGGGPAEAAIRSYRYVVGDPVIDHRHCCV